MKTELVIVLALLAVGCSSNTSRPAGESSRAPHLTDKEMADRYYSLADLAKQAFKNGKIDQSQDLANELLKFDEHFQDNWNHGNAIHDGNMILGRIALRHKRVDLAEEYLQRQPELLALRS